MDMFLIQASLSLYNSTAATSKTNDATDEGEATSDIASEANCKLRPGVVNTFKTTQFSRQLIFTTMYRIHKTVSQPIYN